MTDAAASAPQVSRAFGTIAINIKRNEYKVMPDNRGYRPAAVAGKFYPANPEQLRHTIEKLLSSAPSDDVQPAPLAIIAPHAGYIYSGPIAGSAYATWKASRESIRRVVLIGPAHYVAVKGLAASSAEGFETPLGRVPVDVEAVRSLVAKGLASISDHAHAEEHALEVHLPFLQVVLKDFKIVPLLAGDATAEQVAAAIEALWLDTSSRVVISSDLSHYLDWSDARELDRRTASSIERLQPEEITNHQACGRTPICGLLLEARRRHMKARVLDLRNSGDTAGPRDQVVGYGAFSLTQT